MHSYDSMIAVHDKLTEMKKHVENITDKSEIINNKAKIKEISEMEKILIAPKIEPSVRLEEVTQRGLSAKCEKILLKNADSFFTGLCKAWNKLLHGWKSVDETLFTSFKERLTDIKLPGKQGPEELGNNQPRS